jgi:hypothetical protein
MFYVPHAEREVMFGIASFYTQTVNALLLISEEGRTWSRKSPGRSHDPLIRRCPNGETRPALRDTYTPKKYPQGCFTKVY